MLIGVDGCPLGWYAVRSAETGGPLEASVYTQFSHVLDAAPPGATIAVDIPIGLVELGARACDLAARRMLAPARASSVFPAPLRSVLGAGSHAEASAIRRASDGKGMSIQAFAITRKVREVDVVLSQAPERATRVFEVHPEVSFAAMNGGVPLQYPKRGLVGRQERLALLREVFGAEPERLQAERPRAAVAADDVLDALAALWSARRISQGRGASLPSTPESDALGRRMAIFY